MFAIKLTAEWAAWVTALAAPLHRRCDWRLAHVVAGILLASGHAPAGFADPARPHWSRERPPQMYAFPVSSCTLPLLTAVRRLGA